MTTPIDSSGPPRESRFDPAQAVGKDAECGQSVLPPTTKSPNTNARNVELELFLPKSDERLHSCRATGGDVRGKSGDGSEEGEHGDVC